MRRLSGIQERAEGPTASLNADWHLERTVPGIAADAERHLAKALRDGDISAAMRSVANILSKLASLAKDAEYPEVEKAIWKAVAGIEGSSSESVTERSAPSLNQSEVEQYKKERAEIEQQYRVQDGRVRSPGKFEGEMIYVPHFWGSFLDGGADDDDGEVLTFRVTPEERAAFPEIGKSKTVRLREREDGFVVEV